VNVNNENFEALKKLLALKKYEKPPSPFFEDFPSTVVSQIIKLQSKKQSKDNYSLIFELINRFRPTPALSGAFAALVIVFLFIALNQSDTQNPMPGHLLNSELSAFNQIPQPAKTNSEATLKTNSDSFNASIFEPASVVNPSIPQYQLNSSFIQPASFKN
jgi:hypothetical protein